MRITVRILTVTLLLTCLAAAQATQKSAAPKGPPPKPTLDRVLNNSLRSAESEFVDAADAMPEDKYSFAPTQGEFNGVRTFALQAKHVATANYMIGAAMLGDAKPPVDIGTSENGPDSMTSKADIMSYLKGSFAYMHKAIGTLTSEAQALAIVKSPFGPNQVTKLSLAILTPGHCFDHYGQMVEYLRMNGIIPPASRPQPGQK
jgi:hypothetical protein